MASRRKSVPVLNYNELNNLSSEIIFKTGRKPKGKFFSVNSFLLVQTLNKFRAFLCKIKAIFINTV
jgi:hypothetical protein